MTFGPDGTAWLLLETTIATLAPGADRPVATRMRSDVGADQIALDGQGGVWFNTYFPGTAHLAADGTTIARCSLGGDYATIPFVLDAGGNVWTGASKFAPDGTLLLRDLPGAVRLQTSRGDLVAFAQHEVLWLDPTGKVETRQALRGLELYPSAIDGQDVVWAYEHTKHALWRITPERAEAVQDNLPSVIKTMRTGRDGRIRYLDYTSTVYRLDQDGRSMPLGTVPDQTFFLDPQGRVWAPDRTQTRVLVYEAPTP